MTLNDFWQKFLESKGKNQDEFGFSGEISFEQDFNGRMRLLDLLSGRRTAIFSPLEKYEIDMEILPVAGEFYIIEDFDENPKCIIEITEVFVIPFDEISWEIAKKDGEAHDLEEWRKKERENFETEAEICGFNFSEKTKIVCEIFKIVFC